MQVTRNEFQLSSQISRSELLNIKTIAHSPNKFRLNLTFSLMSNFSIALCYFDIVFVAITFKKYHNFFLQITDNVT